MTNKEFLTNLGIEIKVCRVRRNMNREQVSKLTGLSTSAISKLENGQTDGHILTYKRIADVLGVNLADLM